MFVSILIPTFKRLGFLKRAIEDARAQTYKDWELVVTDDEVGDGETWRWLVQEAGNDSRIRIIKNLQDKHGQVFNVNNGLKICNGEWIKPLFDDDRMLPNCLEKLVEVANRLECFEAKTGERIAMIGCRAQKWRGGELAGDEKDFTIKAKLGEQTSTINVITQRDCRRAICMYDRWNGRTPTHMLIRRTVIDAGALMPEDGRYIVPVDILWFARILSLGAYAMTSEILVGQCEGEVSSITAGARADEFSLDEELIGAYSSIFSEISNAEKHGLTKKDIVCEINGIRGIYHLRCGQWCGGFKKIMRALGFNKGLRLTFRWLLQEMFPQQFPATARAIL